MTRYVVPLTMLALFAGCQGQKMPSMNVLAPYGPTRIPPPSTGSFGQPNTYYQPGQQGAPQVAPGEGGSSGVTTQPLSLAENGKPTLASAASATGQSDGSSNDEDSSKTSSGASEKEANSSQVRLASASRELGSEPPPRIVEPRNQKSSHSIELNGMHVNDATPSDEPGRFVAPERMADISQLPPATRPAPQSVETRPISTRPPASAPAAERSPQKSSTENQSPGWQTRENAQPTLRVAGR